MAADGLITIKSGFGPEETVKRLEAEVTAKDLTGAHQADESTGDLQDAWGGMR